MKIMCTVRLALIQVMQHSGFWVTGNHFVIQATTLFRLRRAVVKGRITNMAPRPMGASTPSTVCATTLESLALQGPNSGPDARSGGSAGFHKQPQERLRARQVAEHP